MLCIGHVIKVNRYLYIHTYVHMCCHDVVKIGEYILQFKRRLAEVRRKTCYCLIFLFRFFQFYYSFLLEFYLVWRDTIKRLKILEHTFTPSAILLDRRGFLKTIHTSMQEYPCKKLPLSFFLIVCYIFTTYYSSRHSTCIRM